MPPSRVCVDSLRTACCSASSYLGGNNHDGNGKFLLLPPSILAKVWTILDAEGLRPRYIRYPCCEFRK